MVTNKEQALDGLKNGELALADISLELRSDEEIAVTAIREYGESAVTFLTATNSLPHTPEVFLAILENTKINLSEKLQEDGKITLEGIKNADYDSGKETDIDMLIAEYFNLAGDLRNIDAAIEKLTKYIEEQKIPQKGGQEH